MGSDSLNHRHLHHLQLLQVLRAEDRGDLELFMNNPIYTFTFSQEIPQIPAVSEPGELIESIEVGCLANVS